MSYSAHFRRTVATLSAGAAFQLAGAPALAQMPTPGSAPRSAANEAVQRQGTVAEEPVNAASQNPSPVNDATAGEKDIVVTGSRISASGFSAPTPTTVVSAEAIARNAQPNVFATIAQLPALQGSSGTSVNNGSTGSGNNALSSFGLRGLGTNRTLTLLDGQRIVAANVTGIIDVSQLPQLLIERVDVVTGGASASYGSDAVAGVVNVVTNRKFEGIKLNAQGGISTYGDGRNGLIQVAVGKSLLNDRLHAQVSVEYFSDRGVPAPRPGDYRSAGPNGRSNLISTAIQQYTIAQTPAGQPQLRFITDAQAIGYSAYGLITAGPLQGTAFGPNGTYQFQYGSGGIPARNATGAVSGCLSSICQGGDLSGIFLDNNLAASIDRKNAYGRVSYDLASNFNIFATVNYSRVKSVLQPNAGAGKVGLTIQCDNALLPTSVAAACVANNITSFTFGTSNLNFPRNPSVHTDREQQRYVVGFDGQFEVLGSEWKVDSYYQHGVTHSNIDIFNQTLTPRYNAAIDAVRVNGQIVCRSVVARGAGCIPMNIFGTTRVDEAAFNYVAPAIGPRQRVFQREEAASLSFSGSPLRLPAGDISLAFGVEYRQEAYRARGDIYGAGAPVVAGVAPITSDYPADPLLNTQVGNNWFAGNFHNGAGKYDVYEGFAELNIPLFDSETIGRANFNPAIRRTHYSTSGSVNTWKLGGTWDTPIDGLRLRAVRSRDIRAPNLSELYAAQVIQTLGVTDRATGQAVTVLNTAIGNPDLKPEIASNLEVGAVLRPTFLSGFNVSFDYFDIKISKAIASLSNQQIVDLCFNGNTAFCANVFLGGSNGGANPSYVIVQPFNLASIKTRGFDIEASYQFGLAKYGLPGSFTVRGLATHVISLVTDPGVPNGVVQQGAGWNFGTPTTVGGGTGTPHWKVLGIQSWNTDAFNLSFTERWVSAGKINPNYIECGPTNCPLPTIQHPTINFNRIPGAFYFDIGGSVKLTSGVEAYFKVDNVGNKLLPQYANPSIYDTIGRIFRVGVRATL